MFMEKSEWSNIARHLKMRFRDCKGIRITSILLGLLFLGDSSSIIGNLKAYQEYPGMVSYGVFSDIALGIISIAIIYYSFQYSEYNENHQIFPHTQTTHFIAFELYCYLMNVILQFVALGLYLILYLLCLVLSRMDGNFYEACSFSLPFILTGFFVSLCYGFLYTSFIILIATLVRKFRWWALAVYISILAALWITKDLNIIQGIIDFYSKEASVAVFFLKAIGTLLILEVLNQVIHPRINNNKIRKFNYPQLIIVIFILLTYFMNLIAFNQRNNTISSTTEVLPMDTLPSSTEMPACILDAKSLVPGSTLNIDYEVESMYYCNTSTLYDNSSENKIKIYFIPPRDMRNNINLSDFTNPKVEATLTDHTLYLKISHNKNVKIVAIAPFTAPMQFDCFKNKPYSTNYIFSSSTSYPGSIKVVIPKSMQIKTHENISQLQISQ